MNTKYLLNIYTITYSDEKKKFLMHDVDGNKVGEDTNGRELGRDAWADGAEKVVFDYDLGLDEHIPLLNRYEKYKARNRVS